MNNLWSIFGDARANNRNISIRKYISSIPYRGMRLKADFSKKGLEIFFKDYQLEALRVLWDTGGDLSSREVWEGVNNRHGKISRASIINFLTEMNDESILLGYDTTGKGGHRTIYSSHYSEDELKRHLASVVIEKMNELLS